ncbi:hypothetical protein [Sphaerochaeta sp.]|uniref:hypothetical protein n=1 Tax=Sphaerochaeta sp. TaxID=1972642 RepID=UPI002FC5E0E7
MYNVHARRLLFLACLLVVSVPLVSLPLDDLVQKALAQSSQMQDLELTKQNALLSQGISQAKAGVDVTLSSGTVSAAYNTTAGAYDLKTTGVGATFVFPDDGKTTIDVSLPIAVQTPGSAYALTPSVEVSHTITYGYTADNQENLLNQQTEVLALSTYDTSKLQFTSSIYTQISRILANEQSIKKTQKEIADLKRSVEQALQLKTLKQDSLAYQAQTQAIQAKQAALASYTDTKELLLAQFSTLTSFAWDGVQEIKEPDLNFSSEVNGNSSVRLKSLALDLAKEALRLKQAEFTNRNLVVGGGIGGSSANAGLIVGVPAKEMLQGSASATLSAKQFSVTAKVYATYDVTANDFSPSVSVGGTWKNNPTDASDRLTLQKAENEVMLAQLAYTSARDEYASNAAQLQSDIASWKLQYALLKQTIAYDQNLLEQQKTLFAKGLATQQQVDDAAFTVDQDAYTLQTTLLEGLILENRIRTMQI